MLKSKKFFVVGNDLAVRRMIEKRGHSVIGEKAIESADVVVFTGGEDVSPFLYGERNLPTTFSNVFRDRKEVGVFKSTPYNTLKIGICRGAQFLNVMSNGSLWQDVNNHLGNHFIKDLASGELIEVTSTHHQMMRVNDDFGNIIAFANNSTRRIRDGHEEVLLKNDYDDPEVVYYWNTHSLLFQFHPEYEKAAECHNYFWSVVDEYLYPKHKAS